MSKAKANKSANKPDSELKEFEKILADFKEQGEEDQALEKRAEVKKAVAKRKATRRGELGLSFAFRPSDRPFVLQLPPKNNSLMSES